MLQLIYVSSATRALEMDDLVNLLRTSRSNNERLDISGVLLYRKGAFLQVLEGQEQAVDRLYERISVDDRHRDVTTLMRTSVQARDFSDWAMGFRSFGLEHADIPGFTPFADRETIVERLSDKPGPAREAVRRFLDLEA